MPISQSAFDLISADHASPWYSDSGFIARHAAWMASASRLATHRRQFRLVRAFHVRDAAEDCLTLAVGVAGVDEAIHIRAPDQLHDLPVAGSRHRAPR